MTGMMVVLDKNPTGGFGGKSLVGTLTDKTTGFGQPKPVLFEQLAIGNCQLALSIQPLMLFDSALRSRIFFGFPLRP